ncbi:winged helix-turn-helix transcriptional regulator [Mogibacterium sp.]|uniref:winged helix-turn-helix transcriptional regulator n=1 Tax=Mogibacterium sp. TaxID=2049035 RepID=UPI0025F10419|nr:winged helix-turn-helix transcriptional regulator [Mogibacterium sp.]
MKYELSKQESMRFGELKKAIPNISNTVLTSTLKELVTQGLVLRHQFNEVPPHVEYSLAESAKALDIVFQAMSEWGNRYL